MQYPGYVRFCPHAGRAYVCGSLGRYPIYTRGGEQPSPYPRFAVVHESLPAIIRPFPPSRVLLVRGSPWILWTSIHVMTNHSTHHRGQDWNWMIGACKSLLFGGPGHLLCHKIAQALGLFCGRPFDLLNIDNRIPDRNNRSTRLIAVGRVPIYPPDISKVIYITTKGRHGTHQ